MSKWWAVLVMAVVARQAHAQAVAADDTKQREWSVAVHKTPLPKAGCFEAAYPATAWTEVPCKAPPAVPMVPRIAARPFVVGNGNDVSAQAPAGTISQAIGTFTSVSGVTSESSPIGNNGPSVPDAYTLQVNTNPFASALCPATSTSCQGWEQYVYFNDGTSGSVFIQYWLLLYNNPTCPAGWNFFQFTAGGASYCFRNAASGAATPNQPIGNLIHLTLSGSASATSDSVALSTGTHMYAATGDHALEASTGWQFAEFNVFGAGGNNAGGGAATFNAGAQVSADVQIFFGGNQAPLCSAQGFTGETNNLSFGPGTPGVPPAGPALGFTESTAGGAVANCAAAQSIGDTHLTTVKGLLYDFQASGDFVVAEVPDFAVHARQVSGAPTWPSAAVNHDVGARFGKRTVAVCMGGRAFVDGKPAEIGALPRLDGDDLTVAHVGNAYIFIDERGNSLRAEVNATWINVSLGFGSTPAAPRGLIANTTNPIAFDDLYHAVADGLRVARDPLLAPCGEGAAGGIPASTFTAGDLPRETRDHAQGVCTAHGVKPGALLDACTLDVAVLGTDDAATVFATLPPPTAVGTITGGAAAAAAAGHAWWRWWWIAAILLALILLWLLLRRRR